ncbi:hypothetical protein FRB99_002459 [Tulasnella sp. 403]|nr:hypothetical protein FRB99_002459 [Tulasnella sp. 403]
MPSLTDAAMAAYIQYTESPNTPPAMVFPTHGFQILSSIVSLVGITVLTYCFARRSDYDDVWSWRGLSQLPWPRLCVILIFLDSWAFIFSASVLVTGAGLSANTLNCSLAIFSCILLYAGSKLLIYLFLIEKVYIVWAPHGTGKTTRMNTPVWRVSMLLLTPLIVILAILIWGRIAVLRQDRVCVIGLKKVASLSLLSYDLFMTVVLTTLFVYPLWTSKVSARLRKVASRTLVASCAALITSCVNVIVLTILHGKELGWVCLSSCGTDVTLNAIAIYWVTNNSHQSRSIKDSLTPPTGPMTTDRATGVAHTTKPTTSNSNVTGEEIRLPNLRPNTIHSPRALSHHGDGVPATIRASRITHFTDEAKAGTSTVRVERKKKTGILSGIAEVFKSNRESPVEEHNMSVQVTVTTEYQIPHQQDEAKYPPSESDLSFDTSRDPPKSPGV